MNTLTIGALLVVVVAMTITTADAKLKGCVSNGKYYASGEQFWNECNSCKCINGAVGCNQMACKKGGCYHNGKFYNRGQQYRDECNTCTCAKNGKGACTKKSCN